MPEPGLRLPAMLEPDPGKAPAVPLRERLPALALQLDVTAISVLLRPVLLGDGRGSFLRPLTAYSAAGRVLSELTPELERELLWLGRRRRIEAEDPLHGPWLRSQRFSSLRVLLGPANRAPSVFFLCFAQRPSRPEPADERLALATIESLCERLAPPEWLPLAAAPSERSGGVPASAPLRPMRHAVEEVERILLRRALLVAEGNKSLAARSLHMTRSALYRKLRRYGLLDG